ncbi:hypothetical protein BB559_004769 [Furculomyces boomerangus]|nr:hypothetical protein BB559_004769 [Furculomyces boomerangus]
MNLKMDIKRHMYTKSKSDNNLVLLYTKTTSFVDKDKLFSPRNEFRGHDAPMEIDREEFTNWLKLDPADGPAKKRPFYGFGNNNDASSKNNTTIGSDGFGTGGRFLFTPPTKMNNVREIDTVGMDIDTEKPVYRSQDSQPISTKVPKKMSKERSLVISNLYKKFDKAKEDKKSSDLPENTKNMENLFITPKKNSKQASTNFNTEDSESSSSAFEYTSEENSQIKTFDSKKKKQSAKKSMKKYQGKLDSIFDSTMKSLQVHRDIPFVVTG